MPDDWLLARALLYMGLNTKQTGRRIKMINLQVSPLQARFWKENSSFAWPDVDIAENEKEYKFSFEIPGAARDDIKIWMENDILTVSGEKKKVLPENGEQLVSERPYGKFERTFRLNKPVEKNGVKAEFFDGILVITLPKAAESKPREISIN
jgi:HSP20 family protein